MFWQLPFKHLSFAAKLILSQAKFSEWLVVIYISMETWKYQLWRRRRMGCIFYWQGSSLSPEFQERCLINKLSIAAYCSVLKIHLIGS